MIGFFLFIWQSEKRRQDLLAEILLEEQHGREISKIVKELLPEPKNTIVEKPVRAGKVQLPLTVLYSVQ